MCTLADMGDLPRKSAAEFLQKDTAVAEILQVDLKPLWRDTMINVLLNRILFKIKLLITHSLKSGSRLKAPRRGSCQRFLQRKR